MYPDLQKELSTFERRTPKSAEAHKKNLKRIPLGVASNYRAYDPWPIFVKEASGSKFRDLDGNEYIDHNLTFGALMAGHCHPAVMKAVSARLSTGTMFGMPHDMEWQLAEEICQRFPVEMCRFGNSGTEATMHAVRLARAATGRDKIVKFEGGYHGLHHPHRRSRRPRSAQVRGRQCPRCPLQRSQHRRTPLQRKSRRNRGHHPRAHHDERRSLLTAARLHSRTPRYRDQKRCTPDPR